MALAYDASTGSYFSEFSGGTHTVNHTPSGTPKAAILFLFTCNTTTQHCTGVTYGGTAMSNMRSSGIPPWGMSLVRVLPSTSSMVMKC